MILGIYSANLFISSKSNFSLDNLEAAKTAYERIVRKISNLRKESHKGADRTMIYEKEFLKAINDDLNVSKALNVFWKVLEDFDFSVDKKLKLLENFDSVLGLGVKNMREKRFSVSPEIEKLLATREALRASKKWAEADILRKRIEDKGYGIEDNPKGPRLREI